MVFRIVRPLNLGFSVRVGGVKIRVKRLISTVAHMTSALMASCNRAGTARDAAGQYPQLAPDARRPSLSPPNQLAKLPQLTLDPLDEQVVQG